MVSDDEAAHVTVIFCQEAGIVSLKGIERFPNLRVLNCIRNHISSLDLSANRALETLWCHDNPLVELDVSGCPVLDELDCRGNPPLESVVLAPGCEPALLYKDPGTGIVY